MFFSFNGVVVAAAAAAGAAVADALGVSVAGGSAMFGCRESVAQAKDTFKMSLKGTARSPVAEMAPGHSRVQTSNGQTCFGNPVARNARDVLHNDSCLHHVH